MPDTRVRVDFNDIRHGRLRALARNADDPSAVAVGARVELWDDDGNAAEGRVVEVTDRGLVWLELVRGTWRDAPDPPAQTWTLGVTTTLTTNTTTLTANQGLSVFTLSDRSQLIFLLVPHHGSRWDQVQSVSSSAPATAELATAGR